MQRILIGILRAYKRWVSPWLPSACRFHPTCSVYAREAIERHGARRGLWLAVKRLARCHPFHPGGFDPVPAAGRDRAENTPVSGPSPVR
ncbi:MAG TPA: membrane protein insertion efficiency factor YidD [Bryobacterales bacterium]|nr:membrane protein insertion efficiency factor YidD [Bryobacterales bacterium]